MKNTHHKIVSLEIKPLSSVILKGVGQGLAKVRVSAEQLTNHRSAR